MNFGTWLQAAEQGEQFTYFKGHLANARAQNRDDLKPANEAWFAARKGLVTLIQKRNSYGTFDYIAVRGKFEGPKAHYVEPWTKVDAYLWLKPAKK